MKFWSCQHYQFELRSIMVVDNWKKTFWILDSFGQWWIIFDTWTTSHYFRKFWKTFEIFRTTFKTFRAWFGITFDSPRYFSTILYIFSHLLNFNQLVRLCQFLNSIWNRLSLENLRQFQAISENFNQFYTILDTSIWGHFNQF